MPKTLAKRYLTHKSYYLYLILQYKSILMAQGQAEGIYPVEIFLLKSAKYPKSIKMQITSGHFH